LDLVRAGNVRTIVDRVVPFEEVPAAVDDFEMRRTTGRVVVRVAAP
jgi:NADPH:quinone reductase-like Zn-dependent oxidoreductase